MPNALARWAPRLVLAGAVVAALALRWTLLDVQSGDYRSFLDPWYSHLAEDGWSGLGDTFSNYNTPYLVLLYLATLLPVPELVAIKAISIVFDLLLASFAYRIVAVVRPGSRWWPTVLASLVLLLPTVVLNSAAWAQCDAIYASLCLGSFYFLLTRRPWRAALLFGLAFAFKLQAIFFLPVLVLVLLVNRMRLRTLLAAPVAFFAALVPALLAGRSLLSQLAVYPSQITGGSGAGGMADPARRLSRGVPRGGGEFGPPTGGPGFDGGGGGGGGVGTGHAFTYNAPTPYAWLPVDASDLWKYGGLVLAAIVGLAFGIWLLRRRRPLSPGAVLAVAASVTLVIPLLLPEMHERYFYLAETLLVLAVAADRRMVVPAIGIQLASVSTYVAYLGNREVVSLEVAAAVALAAAVMAAIVVVDRIRRDAADAAAVGGGGQDGAGAARTPGRDLDRAERDPVAPRQA